MYFFFGDSHSRQFVGTSFGIFSHYIFSGATIKGLVNNQSVTGHAALIRHAVTADSPKTLFFMFGSVDLDFSYVRAHCIGACDRDGFIDERIGIYADFLESLAMDQNSIKKIFVIAPQISPLRGDNFLVQTPKHIGIEESRLRETALRAPLGDLERAGTVIAFNDRLETRLAGAAGRIQLLRIDRDMVDETQAVRDAFVPPDPNEHHARIDQTQRLWRPIINAHITEHIIAG